MELLRGELDVRVVGDVLLVCGAAGHVDRLDPYGVSHPERLFERASYRFGSTERAWNDWPFAFGRQPSDDAVPATDVAIDLRDGSAVLPPNSIER